MKKKTNFLKISVFLALIFSGFSSFAQVYARLERAPDTFHLNDDWDYHEVYDWYIRFYNDAACTSPATLTSDITVNFKSDYYLTMSYSSNNYHDVYNSPITAYSGDTEIYLEDRYSVLIDYDDYNPSYWVKYEGHYQILPGTGYIVVPSSY